VDAPVRGPHLRFSETFSLLSPALPPHNANFIREKGNVIMKWLIMLSVTALLAGS
jgi:hypothetical protein